MNFLDLTEITIEVSILILFISLIRCIFRRRLNPNTKYFLWLFVAIRVLIPFQINLSLELPEKWRPFPFETQAVPIAGSAETGQDIFPMILSQPSATEPTVTSHYAEKILQDKSVSFTKEQILILFWLCGVLLMMLYIIINNVMLFWKLKTSRRKVRILPNKIPLYAVPSYNCLAGVLFPAIYVDIDGLQDTAAANAVILHELQHYRVRDNYWQLLRTLCLVLQWHNPLMWWAYSASRKDCEMACDARVVKSMSKEERYQYSCSLLTVLECTVRKKANIGLHTSMGANKKILSERINAIMKYRPGKTIILSTLIILVIGCTCLISIRVGTGEENTADTIQTESEPALDDIQNAATIEKKDVNINVVDYYITNTGDPSNLYHVDENHVLWGCGRNNYGQLGQGTQDYDFHEEMVPIAEDVIHVDFFTIYLTADHRLYGMGNAGCGALQQYEEFDAEQYMNGEHYTVTSPVLLMEDVVYARCGRSDVACLLSDGSVWIWGAIGFIYDGWNYIEFHYEQKPVKVLENAVMVTGGLFNHAALLGDGSVWTWGYNHSGNCGVADEEIVSRPQKVAEDVIMVWTASMQYNTDCHNIAEFGGMYERFLENTIIQKQDGSYWICGANVGAEEKVLKYYYEVMDYPLVCTYKFLPYNNVQ